MDERFNFNYRLDIGIGWANDYTCTTCSVLPISMPNPNYSLNTTAVDVDMVPSF